MSIIFNKEKKIFKIENNNFSYIFYINQLGILVKLYLGKKINDLDLNSFSYINNLNADSYNFLDLKTNKEVINDKDNYFSGLTSDIEAPSFLTYDKRGPLVIINHQDNSSLTDFRYVSHKIYKDKKPLEGLPHFDNKDVETLEITLKDLKDNIYLIMYYSIYDGIDGIIRHNEIINKTKKEIRINRINSLCLDLPSLEYDLLSVYGTYATDRILERQKLTHNIISITENSGGKGFYHNPMCMLINKEANDNYGEVIGLGLVYSSNFKFDFIGNPLNKLRVLIGINDENFEYVLDSNKNFISPEAIIIYSNEGINKVTHQFHDLIREHILRKVEGFENTILLNSWEGCMFDFDTNKIMNFISKAKKMDVNLFVLDDGWFSKRNDDFSSLGDWEVNTDKIDLKKVIDYAHSLNIKFGIWIEPEMISFNSDLFKEHPDYALMDKDVNPTTLRHQLVLNLTKKEVRDSIFSKICKIFDTYDIDYCKWDFNRILTEAIDNSNFKINKSLYHNFILGTYDLLNRFINRYPKILLETCAGGGGRFDLGMLYYSSQIWGSDETDGVSRTLIQYATNLFYPLKVIGAHVSARKFLSIKEKASIAMFGTFGYELDPTKLTDEDLIEVKVSNKRFLDNKELIDEGDYYPLISPYNNNFVSFEVVSKDKKELIFFFMNYRQVNWESRFIKLKGLDKNKLYKNDYDNNIFYGDFYMNVGLNLSMGMQSFTPLIIKLTQIDDEK